MLGGAPSAWAVEALRAIKNNEHSIVGVRWRAEGLVFALNAAPLARSRNTRRHAL